MTQPLSLKRLFYLSVLALLLVSSILPVAQAAPVAEPSPPPRRVTSDPWEGMPWSFDEGLGAVNPQPTQPGPEAIDLARSPDVDFSQIVSGEFHACGLTNTGGVKCWGRNQIGQLGNGRDNDSSVPVDVSSLFSGVRSVAAGRNFTCALLQNGGVKCWGGNNFGQLGNGDGSYSYSYAPEDVVGLTSGVASIGTGAYHTCAVLETGAVKCWGYNFYGQVGTGSDTTNRYNTPQQVVGLNSGAQGVGGGDEHSCALMDNGGVKCWGWNEHGQIGDGSWANRLTPRNVVGLSQDVTAIGIGGNQSCGILDNGALVCWGDNTYGQLGNNDLDDSNRPVDVEGLSNGVVSVAAGGDHACAVTSPPGKTWCWGYNFYGQLGIGNTLDKHLPFAVVGLSSGVGTVTAGEWHTCALLNSGQTKCWGNDNYGQLSDGRFLVRGLPNHTTGFSNQDQQLALGELHSCSLSYGSAKCWGYNAFGQLGDGTTVDRPSRVSVSGLGTADALVAGKGHTCGLTRAGGVKCWGNNEFGQLGNGNTDSQLNPDEVIGLSSGVQAIAAGDNHTCALKDNGAVKCWGLNQDGQLGDGTTVNRKQPVNVVSLQGGVTAIALGGQQYRQSPDYLDNGGHSCALTEQGGVKCWGDNGFGQLGDDTTEDRHTPVDVVSLASGVASIDLGGLHSCAGMDDGSMKCWGLNYYGQLGDNTAINSSVPTRVTFFEPVVVDSVSAGAFHTCAMVAGGKAMCWGWNQYSQAGTGVLYVNTRAPKTVVGIEAGASVLEAGGGHSCALVAGRGKCWGWDAFGQLGVGSDLQSNVPRATAGAMTPSLIPSYSNGQPGSFFTINGLGFRPFTSVAVSANGVTLDYGLPVRETGEFLFFLDSTGSPPDTYDVSASNTYGSASIDLLLADSDPLRPQEGGGLTYHLPSSRNYPVFLPLAESR
ncbi:MAG: RCC1 repeat-containing protein [Chloroflexota bacterium]|nr:RCC1 repeat-containing protein [Chloroflexota bacterium]